MNERYYACVCLYKVYLCSINMLVELRKHRVLCVSE